MEIPAHLQNSERSAITQRQRPIIQIIQKILKIHNTAEILQVQFFDDVVDAADVIPTGTCDPEVQKTVKIAQVQYIVKVVVIPVVVQHQTPTIQTVQKTVEVPQNQCLHRWIDVPW